MSPEELIWDALATARGRTTDEGIMDIYHNLMAELQLKQMNWPGLNTYGVGWHEIKWDRT